MEQQLTPSRQALARQCGISLIELLVGIAISLVVLSALVYIYVGSRGAYRTNEALSRVQENGRFALDLMAREIRQAGYAGCLSRGAPLTDVRKDQTRPLTLGALAVRGYEAGSGFATPSGLTLKPGADVLELSLLGSATARIISNVDEKGLPNFKIDRPIPIDNRDDVIVTNCNDGVLATRTNASTTTNFVISPGTNLNTIMGYGRQNRSILAIYEKVRFFIARPANTSLPWSLYRASVDIDDNVIAPSPEPIVENIEDMDLLFGFDTNNDGSADEYRRADAITVAGNEAQTSTNWSNVVGIRVSLLVRSTDNGAVLSPQSYALRDADANGSLDAVTPNDRYFRQVFASTVALRNRLP